MFESYVVMPFSGVFLGYLVAFMCPLVALASRIGATADGKIERRRWLGPLASAFVAVVASIGAVCATPASHSGGDALGSFVQFGAGFSAVAGGAGSLLVGVLPATPSRRVLRATFGMLGILAIGALVSSLLALHDYAAGFPPGTLPLPSSVSVVPVAPAPAPVAAPAAMPAPSVDAALCTGDPKAWAERRVAAGGSIQASGTFPWLDGRTATWVAYTTAEGTAALAASDGGACELAGDLLWGGLLKAPDTRVVPADGAFPCLAGNAGDPAWRRCFGWSGGHLVTVWSRSTSRSGVDATDWLAGTFTWSSVPGDATRGHLLVPGTDRAALTFDLDKVVDASVTNDAGKRVLRIVSADTGGAVGVVCTESPEGAAATQDPTDSTKWALPDCATPSCRWRFDASSGGVTVPLGVVWHRDGGLYPVAPGG